MAEKALARLHEVVLREYHAVSYKWLSRDQGISPNQAKRCLFKFARDAGDKVICTYCVTGRHLSGVGVTLVVGADRLEEAKRSLEHLTGIHVHCVHPRAAGALGSAPHLALELDQAESLYQDLVARKRPNALVAPTARDVAFDPHWGSAGTRPAAPLAPEHVGQAAPAPSKGAVAKEAPHKPGNAPAPDAGQGKAPVTQPKGEATKAASGKVAAMFGAAQRKAPAKDSAARPGQGGAEPKAGAVAPGKESAAGPASRAAMEDEESEEDEMARSKRWRAAVIDSESEDEAGAAGPAHAGGGGGAAPAATGGRQGRKLRKEERVTLDDRGRETVEVVWVDAVTGEVVSEGAGAPREAGDAAGSGGAQAAEGPREGPAPAQAGSTKGGAGPKAGSEPSLPKGGPGRPAKGGVVKGSGKGQAAQGGKQQKTVLNFFQKK